MFSRIKKEKTFTEERTKFYAAQVFMALECLHKMGFVYRDLKPENILFDTNGYIKVSDYGLAKQLKNGEKTYSLTGTASYLSTDALRQVHKLFLMKVILLLSIGGLWEF